VALLPQNPAFSLFLSKVVKALGPDFLFCGPAHLIPPIPVLPPSGENFKYSIKNFPLGQRQTVSLKK
jgi:hypothetical protein